MRKYIDFLFYAGGGGAIVGATITVLETGTSTKATLYSDDGITALANPVATDEIGYFSFYVADGTYDFAVSDGVYDCTLTDIEIYQYSTMAHKGANIDITSMIGITGGISSPTFLQFATSGATGGVARLTWNDTDGTLDLGLKGGNVTLQIGQEQVVRVTNQTGSTITDGQAVYVTGSTGNHLNVLLAQANSEATSSKTLAIVTEHINNNQSGFATVLGLVRDLDTSTLTEGAAIWLSASVAGGLTTTRPTQPNHGVFIGWCVRQHATVGSIFVNIQNGYEINELHDVLITGTPTAGSLLIRDATNALWKNARLTAGTGVSISNADAGITITNSAPDQTVSLTAGTGISTSGTYPSFTITNSAPDQIVSLTAGTNVTITGSYPSFTIAAAGGSGSGTVTNVSVVTTNGFAGTVATSTTTPAITLTTTVTGLVKGNGSAISAASAGTDYVAPGAYTTSGLTMATARLLGRTTTSTGAAEEISIGTGLTLSGGSLVNSAPDLTVSFTNGTGISVTGTYPAFTITNSAPMTYPGAGIAVSTGSAWGTSLTAPSGAIVGTTDTQTLTNKRITARVNAQTTTSSPWAWNSDSYDQQSFSALANALTINADAGTPIDGQKAMFRFKDNGTAQGLTWTTGTSKSFRAIGVTLPTTTVISKTLYVGCVYNAADSRWDAVAVSQEA